MKINECLYNSNVNFNLYIPGQWLLVARCSPRVSVHTISAKMDVMWTEITKFDG